MNHIGERKRFYAKCLQFRKKKIYGGVLVDTILIGKVTDATTGNELKDHAWIELTPAIREVQVNCGDWFSFDANVGTYIKGVRHKTNKTLEKAQMSFDAGLFGIQNVIVMKGEI